MNEGVQILIDRMKSNPEDFAERDFGSDGRITQGKFRSVADLLRKRLSGESPAWDAMNVLTTEEIEALTAAYVEMERQRFTTSVMAKLLEDKEEENRYGVIAQPAMTLSANGSLGIGTAPSNGWYTAGSAGVGTQTQNAVTIAPHASGPSIDFNAQNINTLNEMIAKWRGEEDGTV